MGEKGLTKLVLIMSLVLFAGSIVALILVSTVGKKLLPSEENTTEFTDTIRQIETSDENNAIIYTEEYGRLQINDLQMVSYSDDIASLRENPKYKISNWLGGEISSRTQGQIAPVQSY